MKGETAIRLAWTSVLAIAWPLLVIWAFHVLGLIGIIVLGVAPGILAVAAAEDSARWRRIMGASVAIATAVGVVVYGVIAFDTVGCGVPGTSGDVAWSMLPVAAITGIGAGITAWQGGRLLATFRHAGPPLALILGWAMLLLAAGAAIVRGISVSCFGY